MMTFCLRTLSTALALVFCYCTMPSSAQAHPHSWIDIHMDLQFTKDGSIKALHQNWLFDEGYSIFVLDKLAGRKASAADPATFQSIADKITGNLAPYGYFTKTLSGTKPTEPATLSETHAQMRNNRLSLDLTLNFPHPVPANGFSYKVYDPTYYVEMLHAEGPNPVHLEGAPKGCSYSITAPNPPIDAVVKAASMAVDSVADNKLGQLFAESVAISCP